MTFVGNPTPVLKELATQAGKSAQAAEQRLGEKELKRAGFVLAGKRFEELRPSKKIIHSESSLNIISPGNMVLNICSSGETERAGERAAGSRRSRRKIQERICLQASRRRTSIRSSKSYPDMELTGLTLLSARHLCSLALIYEEKELGYQPREREEEGGRNERERDGQSTPVPSERRDNRHTCIFSLSMELCR